MQSTTKWFYVQPWFEMPRTLLVVKETTWTLELQDGSKVHKGYGRDLGPYFREYEPALERLRGMKELQIKDAKRVVSNLREALTEFNRGFPKQSKPQEPA